jgi:hypothetical protein
MNEQRREFLEQRKKDLTEKTDKIAATIGSYDPRSTKYLEKITEHKIYCDELDQIEIELSSYEQSSLTKNQRGNRFDKKLPKIDFGKPKKIIDNILSQFGRQGVSAFFLIENTTVTMGDLLVNEIRDDLTKESDDWRHYPISILANHVVDEQSLLTAIASFIPKYDSETQTFDNPQQDAKKIIDKITDGLQVGSIVFLELNDWDALGENQDSLLSWFIKNFWTPLTKKQSKLSQNYANIRIILFMTTCSSLSRKCQDLPYFCTRSKFDNQKIFKLSLQKNGSWKIFVSGLKILINILAIKA